jgi:hypothetical protein
MGPECCPKHWYRGERGGESSKIQFSESWDILGLLLMKWEQGARGAVLKYATINSKIKKVSTENAEALRSDPFALLISNWQLKMSVCCKNIQSIFKLNINYFVIDRRILLPILLYEEVRL